MQNASTFGFHPHREKRNLLNKGSHKWRASEIDRAIFHLKADIIGHIRTLSDIAGHCRTLRFRDVLSLHCQSAVQNKSENQKHHEQTSGAKTRKAASADAAFPYESTH